MPVSGIVVTLAPEPERRAALLARLGADGRFTLGERDQNHLPIVCDTATMEQHRAAWRELEAMPAVLAVELAYSDFSDIEDFGDRPPGRRRRS